MCPLPTELSPRSCAIFIRMRSCCYVRIWKRLVYAYVKSKDEGFHANIDVKFVARLVGSLKLERNFDELC